MSNRKIGTIIFTTILFTYLVISVILFYQLEYSEKSIAKKESQLKGNGYLAEFYLNGVPYTNNQIYFGHSNAPIKIVAYLDFESEESKKWISEYWNYIYEEYIINGTIKFYPKYYITPQDYENKDKKVEYSKALICFSEIKPSSTKKFYLDLFELNQPLFGGLLEKYGVSELEFETCMVKSEFPEIMDSVFEVKNLAISSNPRIYIGVIGNDYTIIDGVQNLKELEQTIQIYETELGII